MRLNSQRIGVFIPAIGLLLFLGLAQEIVSAQEKKEQIAKPFKVPSTPPTLDVAQLQQELQEIVELQRSLQAQHYEQVREIQRITEQARAHQKLLKDLAPPRQPVPVVKPAGIDREELLRLEKIRLIGEEARKNRATLEEIRKQAVEQPKVKPFEGIAVPLLGQESSPSEAKEEDEEPSPPAPEEKPKKRFLWW